MRNQSWAKPGLVCFRRFASLCVEGVGVAGPQIGIGPVNQGGLHTWEQGYLALNSGRRWRMAQGDSTLPAPQRTINARPGSPWAQGVPSSASGGSRAAGSGAPIVCSPGGGTQADSSPGSPGGPLISASPRCMQSHSQEAPGSAPRAGGRLATGRCPHQTLRSALPPSGWARVRIRRRARHTAQSGITAAIRR
ncbi:hypothetical protein NDU88_000652 [Pleurodeles waltl]|uniref:Uncharacterized protein n=1 Tax=Pleurodeles waltl TaxID=8319 RepID=A0AAV7VY51_PLEWA|nr:hypothetical protein NDU88_000652 [Pleurodeles waltl]